MEINSIARKAIADKLASALKREGLTHKEAAELFNMKSDRVSKFLNDKHRDSVNYVYVKKFQNWSNTGENLRAWAKKHNPGAAVHSSQPNVDNTTTPPKKEAKTESDIKNTAYTLKKYMDYNNINADYVAKHLLVDKADILRIMEMHPIPLAAVSVETWGKISNWIEGGLPLGSNTSPVVPSQVFSDEQERKEPCGASIEKIAELLDNKLGKQPDIMLATVEGVQSQDRLGVILSVINELKSLGFDVDIHISPTA